MHSTENSNIELNGCLCSHHFNFVITILYSLKIVILVAPATVFVKFPFSDLLCYVEPLKFNGCLNCKRLLWYVN